MKDIDAILVSSEKSQRYLEFNIYIYIYKWRCNMVHIYLALSNIGILVA